MSLGRFGRMQYALYWYSGQRSRPDTDWTYKIPMQPAATSLFSHTRGLRKMLRRLILHGKLQELASWMLILVGPAPVDGDLISRCLLAVVQPPGA